MYIFVWTNTLRWNEFWMMCVGKDFTIDRKKIQTTILKYIIKGNFDLRLRTSDKQVGCTFENLKERFQFELAWRFTVWKLKVWSFWRSYSQASDG